MLGPLSEPGDPWTLRTLTGSGIDEGPEGAARPDPHQRGSGGAEGYEEGTDGVQGPVGPLPDPPGVRGRTPLLGVYGRAEHRRARAQARDGHGEGIYCARGGPEFVCAD